ncbi:MAG: electron transport complex subunit RsxC [Nitrospirae bacterium]|nr:electron transport complex subunit RsxC [Nitrospirota bacterium]
MNTGTFERGTHPPDNKALSAAKSITEAKVPSRVIIPLSQHIGAPCQAKVAVGDLVKKGQIIGSADAFVSSPVHATVSGKVVAIAPFPHTMGRDIPAIVIENDGKEEWAEGIKEHSDWGSLDAAALRDIVKTAGIVGMGGATFPTHVKLSPPKEKKIDCVIINGAECEPYLTADHRVMLEEPGAVVNGLKILMKIAGVSKGYIGIEDNKPDAVAAMEAVTKGDSSIDVYSLKVKYPQGAEKMLIKAIVGKEVPAGGLPMDVGVIVQNVGTAVAVYEAVRYGRPLLERVVSVTGRGINETKNLKVRIGTPLSQLVAECGGFKFDTGKVIAGGPMMGMAQSNLDSPVIKGTSGLLVLDPEESEIAVHGPCIRCGRCIDACPMGLQPQMLSVLAEKGFYEEMKEYDLMNCFECGTCAYVCPAKRPIVQWVKLAKMSLARK